MIDGGNSNFRDSQRRAALVAERGIRYLDAGVSGGIWGSSGVRAHGRRRGGGGCRRGAGLPRPSTGRRLRPVGPSGTLVKMVHNGVEYGLMQAYAEGFDLMQASEFELDLAAVAGALAARLGRPELAARPSRPGAGREPGPGAHPRLRRGLRRGTLDGGAGDRYRRAAPRDHGGPLRAVASREDESFSAKVNAALREQFGGHAVRRD